MPSPLQELRESWSLTRGEFAAALGVQYNQVFQAEKGRQRLPHAAQTALAELGVDVADLERRQEAWVQDRARRLREELVERLNRPVGEGGA